MKTIWQVTYFNSFCNLTDTVLFTKFYHALQYCREKYSIRTDEMELSADGDSWTLERNCVLPPTAPGLPETKYHERYEITPVKVYASYAAWVNEVEG